MRGSSSDCTTLTGASMSVQPTSVFSVRSVYHTNSSLSTAMSLMSDSLLQRSLLPLLRPLTCATACLRTMCSAVYRAVPQPHPLVFPSLGSLAVCVILPILTLFAVVPDCADVECIQRTHSHTRNTPHCRLHCRVSTQLMQNPAPAVTGSSQPASLSLCVSSLQRGPLVRRWPALTPCCLVVFVVCCLWLRLFCNAALLYVQVEGERPPAEEKLQEGDSVQSLVKRAASEGDICSIQWKDVAEWQLRESQQPDAPVLHSGTSSKRLSAPMPFPDESLLVRTRQRLDFTPAAKRMRTEGEMAFRKPTVCRQPCAHPRALICSSVVFALVSLRRCDPAARS